MCDTRYHDTLSEQPLHLYYDQSQHRSRLSSTHSTNHSNHEATRMADHTHPAARTA
jgi:hypothetical protein